MRSASVMEAPPERATLSVEFNLLQRPAWLGPILFTVLLSRVRYSPARVKATTREWPALLAEVALEGLLDHGEEG